MFGKRGGVTFRGVLAGVVMCGLLGSGSIAQAQPGTCDVKINTPRPGDGVGSEGRVRGTATVPPGTFLWVLAHMKDLVAEWWPQGGRAAVIEGDKTWVIVVGYGQPRDIGEDFEVAAVVVDANTNKDLQIWFAEAKKTKSYEPIPFPSSVGGCVPVKVTVKKKS